jgi:CubicO group peptidase (beta-lactamase class C family)
MNQQTHYNNGALRNQKRIKIAATPVWLLAYVLVASCAVAQTGKLSAEKQAKIENTISNFIAASKAPGISVAVVQDGEFVWAASFGMSDLVNSVLLHHKRCTASALFRKRSRPQPP